MHLVGLVSMHSSHRLKWEHAFVSKLFLLDLVDLVFSCFFSAIPGGVRGRIELALEPLFIDTRCPKKAKWAISHSHRFTYKQNQAK